jgi:sugar/nucleoside kinase (ribokinase family)
MDPLNLDKIFMKYEAMIGVGGIGSGSFFQLDGNNTLGREESRSGQFLDKNDYCKLHIISHYVKALLGNKLRVIPVGKVGNDDAGEKLIEEMNEAGLETGYIEIDKTKHTLFSFCFLYPDHSGGNMTTNDSACSSVDEEYILKTENEFIKYAGKGIALAAPEVSLETRFCLLNLATKNNYFRVASFTSGEMETVLDERIFEKVDLLCINLDEATAILGSKSDCDKSEIVKQVIEKLKDINPKIIITITGGKDGSWIWDGTEISYLPVENVEVISTAGAGDAFTAGMIAGIASGLSTKESHQLANLTGGGSVKSPHTINKELNRKTLLEIAKTSNTKFSDNVLKLLEK